MAMIEAVIKIGGKKYTREEAEQLYKELAAFLGKPEKIVERIIEKPVPFIDARPWRSEKRYPVSPIPGIPLPGGTKPSDWKLMPT